MSEAPEKIYHEVRLGTFGYDQEPEDTVYIRADIVDELAEALEWMIAILHVETETDVKAIDRAEAALRKARGEE